ncbi:MAG TPA: HAD-IA family hydrolase [Burkholderiales bacterium]|jgi:phosphoglycolate phosphatase
MTARRFELLVFDWDGTVVDSAAHIAASIQAACADLGLAVPGEERARYIIGLGLQDAMQHLLPELPVADYPRLAERYRHHYLAGNEKVVPFGGVREGLARLHAAGFLLGVATGKSRRGLDQALRDTGLHGLFHASRCADEGFAKPHPDMLLFLMNRLNVAPARTLMIGDTTHDLEMARNAGVPALAVSYGAHAEAQLTGLAPLACVRCFDDLMAWLETNT